MSYHYLIKRHDPSRGFPPFEHLGTYPGYRPDQAVMEQLPPGNYQAVLMGPDGRFQAARRFCVVPLLYTEKRRSRVFPWVTQTLQRCKNVVVMDRWDWQPGIPRWQHEMDSYARD